MFRMCYVVVTCRTLCWTLLSLASCLIVTAAVVSPQWLLGPPPEVPTLELTDEGRATDIVYIRRHSLGLFNHCGMDPHGRQTACATYVKSLQLRDFSGVWQASLTMMAMAIGILFSAVGGALTTLCLRTVFQRSVYMIMGVSQGTAGKNART